MSTINQGNSPDTVTDSVNVATNHPGLGAKVFALPGSNWKVYFNDNDTTGDFDFNDFIFHVSFDAGNTGHLQFEGALSSWVNTGGFGAAQISAADPSDDFTGLTTGQEVVFSMTNPGRQTWFTGGADRNSSGSIQAIVQRMDDTVVTPEPGTVAMFCLGLLMVASVKWFKKLAR